MLPSRRGAAPFSKCTVLFASMHTVQKDFTNVFVFGRKRHTLVAVLFMKTQTEQVLRQKQGEKKKKRGFSPVCIRACVYAPHNKSEVRGVTADLPLQI